MGSLKKTILSTCAAMLLSSTAFAADLLEPPIIEHTPEVIPVEVGAGWYLRGDIGYAVMQAPDAYWNNTNFHGESLDNTWTGGVGFGYDFTEYFRSDITFDYHGNAEFRARTRCAPGCGTTRERTTLDAWTIMLNGYLDVGTWQGFTPYIGAGIGTSYIKTDNVVGHNPVPPASRFEGNEQWNLSAAAMAGASFEVAPGLMVDAGYRYLWMGDAISGNARGFRGKVHFEDVAAHDIRVGLRYMIE
ncbi:opacity protein-like surface antigen [Rhodobium orientis]|uniref:Outer membrane protein beta-barrel domain-containing protein n=1 Tax=Rhodobium orientis TaxID=34017 RepID=A0A327JSA1_9HYPH|nr:outer membrane protein [Rhodobium orientis]MBB4303023.1 opacity protein-like surface antigen [Rhodobium orientis]MBK5949582.1 hypothetical protein [Rhodobium orientis]RAI29369.1 hypothetical protein CH339_03545 [Rhodobium orientis]